MTIQLPPLPDLKLIAADPYTALRTAQREAALMALEEAAKRCETTHGRFQDQLSEQTKFALSTAAAGIRALRTELENAK